MRQQAADAAFRRASVQSCHYLVTDPDRCQDRRFREIGGAARALQDLFDIAQPVGVRRPPDFKIHGSWYPSVAIS
jgi:hypothetical protein